MCTSCFKIAPLASFANIKCATTQLCTEIGKLEYTLFEANESKQLTSDGMACFNNVNVFLKTFDERFKILLLQSGGFNDRIFPVSDSC